MATYDFTSALAAGAGAGGATFLLNGMDIQGAGIIAGIAAVSCYLFAGPLKNVRLQDESVTAALGTGAGVYGLGLMAGVTEPNIMLIVGAAGGSYIGQSVILPLFSKA